MNIFVEKGMILKENITILSWSTRKIKDNMTKVYNKSNKIIIVVVVKAFSHQIQDGCGAEGSMKNTNKILQSAINQTSTL